MALADDYVVEWERDRVTLKRDGVAVASGRWAGGRIVERSGSLGEGIQWEAIEQRLKRDAQAFVEDTFRAAYDAQGVDTTQIDRMLALTPGERLAALQSWQRSTLALARDVSRD
jgi:hypothetical protein